MKRIIPLLIFASFSFSAFAQNVEETVTLDEVTIKGAKVVSKVDGQMIYPTEAQKNASSNGYSILQKLSLANLRVDDVAHTITDIDQRGSVQIRINNIIVDKQEMLALDPKLISRIDFIDNPSLRYGDDIAYVINIVTRRNNNGYTLGNSLNKRLTSLSGDDCIFGKWNSGKSELTMSYDFNGSNLKGSKTTEVADYTLNDGNIQTIKRNDIDKDFKFCQHDLMLTYNIADSTAYVFQASFRGTMSRIPESCSKKEISDGMNEYIANSRDEERNIRPVLDLYFFRQLTPRQSITANAVGTYMHTQSSSYYDEGTPYQYNVNGKTASALSEVIYENRLNPVTFSAGVNYRYKYMKNDYTGDAYALTELNQNNLYAFSEIKGNHNALRYSLGLGASYIHYNQSEHEFGFWTFRPKVSLAYNLMKGMQLSYTFEMKDRASRIAMISDATIQTNSMEYTVGNPDLKPSRDMEHTIRLSYNDDRWSTSLTGFYRHCDKPNMALYERTSDNKFIYTLINQKEIDVLQVMPYTSYWILPEKLQISAYGGLFRCFNFGNDYTHCYTSWFYSGNITAYLGEFTFRAYTDNGNRFLEGESKGYNGGSISLQTSYQYKDWQFSLAWENPFNNNYKSFESELLNCNLHKLTTGYNRDLGDCVSLSISWRLSKGKKHQSADKLINLSDTDNGIISR